MQAPIPAFWLRLGASLHGVVGLPAKPALSPDALSSRDKAVCDGFVSGTSRKALGAQFGVTPERIGQILHQPGAVLYMLKLAGNIKSLLFAKVGEEILSRTEWGGVKLIDLIAIWKSAMPQEVTVNQRIMVQQEAERVAAELGMTAAEVLAEAQAIIAGAS